MLFTLSGCHPPGGGGGGGVKAARLSRPWVAVAWGFVGPSLV